MSFFNKTNQDGPRASSPLEMIRAAVGISSQKNSFVEDDQVIRDRMSRNLEDSDDETPAWLAPPKPRDRLSALAAADAALAADDDKSAAGERMWWQDGADHSKPTRPAFKQDEENAAEPATRPRPLTRQGSKMVSFRRRASLEEIL